MKYFPRLFLFILLIGLAFLSEAGPAYDITILHTNDFHAHLTPDDQGQGGAANLAGYFNQVKRERKYVLILDAGDMVQGTPVSTIYQGKPIFEIMNVAGYDGATLGNHEFDYGLEMIAAFRKIANFPIITANALADGKLLADVPYKIYDFGWIKVGVLGLVKTEYSAHLPGVTFKPAIETANKYLPELEKNANVIIALTHQGIEADKALAAETKGIDFIIGGHSHTKLEEPIKVGNTVILQAGEYGRQVGRLVLSFYDVMTYSHQWELIDIPVEGVQPDRATEKLVKFWEDKVADLVDVKIADNPKRMEINEVKALIERAWQATYQTDFAWQNDGGTRDIIPAGPVLKRHIWNAMPFDNTLVILKLTRQEIETEIPNPKFIKKKPFHTFITNSYLGEQLIEKYKLPPDRIEWLNISWRDPVIEYVEEFGIKK